MSKTNFFDSKIFKSRVTTRTVSTKEKILGHLIGPLGLIFIINTIAALVEKFFTQQVGAMYANNIDKITQMGTVYETVMTITKLIGIVTGILIPLLISKTKSSNGRFRPLYPFFGILSVILGCTIFLRSDNVTDKFWITFFILLVVYHTIACVFFYLFRDNIVSLSSRSAKEKYELSFIRKASWTLISGIIIGMIINMVVLPLWLEKDINGYALLLIILSIVSIPLIFLEFYYTRERIIEEDVEEKIKEEIPIKVQLKALFSDKFFIIMTIISTVITIADNFKGGNVQYFYIKFCLNGENNPLMYTIYQVVTGVPLGIGAIAIYPLAKKHGIKNVSLIGFALVLVGSIIGLIGYDNTIIACAGGFIKNIGMLPNSYIFITLLYYAFDHIEYKTNLRLEGLMGVGIITAIQQLIYAPFAGGYESGLLRRGFVDAEGVTASNEVIRWIVFSFYFFDILLALVAVILLPFMNIEKDMPMITEELLRRKKEAVLASGKEWIEPEELERIENEKYEAEREKNRILDLKKKCERKGLDFETENNKYLEKVRIKEEKKARKEKKNA